jgi:hypothetical protein
MTHSGADKRRIQEPTKDAFESRQMTHSGSDKKSIAENWGEFCGLLVSAAITSALNGWLLSICAAFLFPSFYLSFWQWWLTAFTIRCLFGSRSSES